LDPTVPHAAAHILDFVYRTETGRDRPACYDVVYGHNQGKLGKRLTAMTLGEVIEQQRFWTKRFGSSAAGAPQFIRTTLQGLAKELSLSGAQRFDGNLQDRLGWHLLKRRGYEDFIAGRITRTAFGNRLAMEWASFPVLAGTKGQKATVKRGQSYYAGDGLNKALVAPARVEAVLDEAMRISKSLPSAPATKPAASPTHKPQDGQKPPATPSGPTKAVPALVAFLALVAAGIVAVALEVLK
jgi:muramidase (phage lysozyme)